MTPISFDRRQLRLYVITDRRALGPRDPVRAVAAAIEGGATLVQYRDKDVGRNVMYETALRLRRATCDRGVPLVVNDYVDLALAVEADAVHLGQTDLPLAAARAVGGDRLWYGVSTHTPEQAVVAARARPAYIAVGPVFPTATKADPDRVIGLEGVRAVRAALPEVPLVAIGGITAATGAAVRAAGADGVSVIRAVWEGADVAAACRAFG